MAPVRQAKGDATFADIEKLSEERAVEIVHGIIVDKASPTMPHGRAQARLAGWTGRYFDRAPGGRWPGGWWIASEVDVEYETHELYRHDLAGWRRERVASAPTDRPVRIRP